MENKVCSVIKLALAYKLYSGSQCIFQLLGIYREDQPISSVCSELGSTQMVKDKSNKDLFIGNGWIGGQ